MGLFLKRMEAVINGLRFAFPQVGIRRGIQHFPIMHEGWNPICVRIESLDPDGTRARLSIHEAVNPDKTSATLAENYHSDRPFQYAEGINWGQILHLVLLTGDGKFDTDDVINARDNTVTDIMIVVHFHINPSWSYETTADCIWITENLTCGSIPERVLFLQNNGWARFGQHTVLPAFSSETPRGWVPAIVIYVPPSDNNGHIAIIIECESIRATTIPGPIVAVTAHAPVQDANMGFGLTAYPTLFCEQGETGLAMILTFEELGFSIPSECLDKFSPHDVFGVGPYYYMRRAEKGTDAYSIAVTSCPIDVPMILLWERVHARN